MFFDPEVLKQDTLVNADYPALVRAALQKRFPEAESRQDRKQLTALISSGAGYQLRDMVLRDPAVIGRTVPVRVPVDDEIDMLLKGVFRRDVPEAERRVSDRQIALDRRTSRRGPCRAALQHRVSDRPGTRANPSSRASAAP